jgi:hypothetical protein
MSMRPLTEDTSRYRLVPGLNVFVWLRPLLSSLYGDLFSTGRGGRRGLVAVVRLRRANVKIGIS